MRDVFFNLAIEITNNPSNLSTLCKLQNQRELLFVFLSTRSIQALIHLAFVVVVGLYSQISFSPWFKTYIP